MAQQIHFNRKEKQLLDRLMARDFVEYRINADPAVRSPRRISRKTDEELAALEESRKVANGA